jgi:phosphonate transport system substrate-binding protein
VKNFIVVILLFALAVGCAQEPESLGPEYATAPSVSTTPVYYFAVHPVFTPTKLNQDYGSLIDLLNEKVNGVRFKLESSRDYGTFEAKIRNCKPELLLPNPWQTLVAMKVGYSVIAMAGDPDDYKGIFIVRRDGGIRHPHDLKGKAVSYPSPTAVAACIMPQYYLHSHGVNITSDIENRYVGSQESCIMSVYLGKTAAGATWLRPWRSFQNEHPKEADELMVLWETPPLISNSVMVRNDVPADVREQVSEVLLRLNDTSQGRTILADMQTARFSAASNADYEIVRVYIDRFEQEVRPVESK